MKKVLDNHVEREVLSLIPDIAFANVPTWYNATRRDLRMDIIAPKMRTPERKLPLIVWICGGAYRCVNRSVWLPEMMTFARNGFVVASIEYRTVNDGGFRESYQDVKSAIRFLKAHAEEYCIDASRICAMGESAGGTLAVFAGLAGRDRTLDQGDWLEYDSSVNAVVDYYGLVDFTHLKVQSDGPDIPPFLLQDFIGLDYTEETALEASPIRLLTPDAPPFLIFHGDSDTRVDVSQSEILYEALTGAGVRADYYVLEGAGHGEDSFYQPDKQEIALKFLREVLG